jgi:trk system potassium uptake protein
MKIVIVGAGEVGTYLCSLLSEQSHHVTLIESCEETVQRVDEQYDVKVINGSGSSAETLVNANVGECDFFLAMTSDDKTNLISISLAKALGAKSTIGRIHDQTYRDNSYINYQLQFGIDYILNPEALCAIELAKAIRNPGRVAVENFARSQIEVQRVEVTRRSKFIGKKIKTLGLEPIMRIGYVQREECIEIASADMILEVGDIVTLFGASESLLEIKEKFDPESKLESVKVALFGGGETAIALIRLLSSQRFKIRVVDNDERKCRQLAERFPEVTVIHGDGTSLRLMEEEQIGSCDYFIACTKKDEDNIMMGLQATKLGAGHVLLVINKIDYEEITSKLKWLIGVELVVSPCIATASEVQRYISTEPFIELFTLPNKMSKIIEIRVGHKSPCASKALREIALPRGCVVVALLHKFTAKVPGGDDKILPDDRVVVITKEENIRELVPLLAGE